MIELTKLKILSDFKNLKDLDINFKQGLDTYVLIGNNGSGKSSILEALSYIFGWLYNPEGTISFDFGLNYKIDGDRIVVSQRNGVVKTRVNGNEVALDVIRTNYLPSRIICNYSGEDMRMKELYYKKPFEDYVSRLASAGGKNDLRMVFIDKDLWDIILLILLVCRDQEPSFDHFLSETLHISHVDEIKVLFNNKKLDGWQDNPTTFYIRQISPFIDAKGNISVERLNPGGNLPFTLFNQWNGARPIIDKLSIAYNGSIDANMLSEGEKKLMVVFFILEAIADERSIVLLDEPDSHIHVARKAELKDYFEKTANRENILTSHSPTLTAKFPEKAIIMLDCQPDGHATVVDKNKQQIVSELTNNIWTLQEQNIFLASNKTVLVVEGKTDEPILKAALASLKKKGKYADMDFVYLPCGGASNVPAIATKFTPKPGQMVITFFDTDSAGWNAIREIFHDKEIKSETFGKAKKNGDIWYTTYPPCKKGVNNFNIEDYFPRSVFLRYVMRFKSLTEIWTKDNLKKAIAEDCKKDNKMTDKQLEKFAFVFDRIQEIMDAEKEGKTSI